eukprot:jgi/Ulvmu1/1832/UM119_0051.1
MILQLMMYGLLPLLLISQPTDSTDTMLAMDDQMVDSSTSALALSFPLHRLEPYCTCVWLDPLVIASGPDLPPMQALPTAEVSDTSFQATVKSTNHIGTSQGATATVPAYVLATEAMETDRQNVADARDGARILFANPEAKNADKLLSADTFSFMRNDCSADKWVTIELSQRVKLTAVDISMLELYSSRVKTFELYGALKKPTKTASAPWHAELWTLIAIMKLENKKGQQAFRLQASLFSKYLLLHFTAHFGSESVCAINNFRAFGITEAEDLEAQLSALQNPEAGDATVHSAAADTWDTLSHASPHVTQAAEAQFGGANIQHAPQAALKADHAVPNGTDDAAKSIHSKRSDTRLHSGDAVGDAPSKDDAPEANQAASAEPAASMSTFTLASSADGTTEQSAAVPPKKEMKCNNALGQRAPKDSAGTAHRVLPHVFNEAVAVAVHDVVVTPAGAPAIVSQHKAGMDGEPDHAQASPAGIPNAGRGHSASKRWADRSGALKMGQHDRQPKQADRVIAQAHASMGRACAPQAAAEVGPTEDDISTHMSEQPSAEVGWPAGTADEAVQDGSMSTGADMSGMSDHDQKRLRKVQTETVIRAKGIVGRDEHSIATASTSEDLTGSDGERTFDVGRRPTAPLHDVAAPSKGGSASVYDLIKKELLALKLETSTLSMSLKQAAPQAALQEAVRKHAETEAKLAFVLDTLLALETRVDGLVAAQRKAASTQLLQLQAACGVMALAMVLCLAVGLCMVNAQAQRLQRKIHNATEGTRGDVRGLGCTGSATREELRVHEQACPNALLDIYEGATLSPLQCTAGQPADAPTRYTRHNTTLSAGNSPVNGNRRRSSLLSLSRNCSDPHMQQGSVHVIRPFSLAPSNSEHCDDGILQSF